MRMPDSTRTSVATTTTLPKVSAAFQEASAAIAKRTAQAMRRAWQAGNEELQALATRNALPGQFHVRATSSGRDARTKQAMLEFVVCWTAPRRDGPGASVEMTLRED